MHLACTGYPTVRLAEFRQQQNLVKPTSFIQVQVFKWERTDRSLPPWPHPRCYLGNINMKNAGDNTVNSATKSRNNNLVINASSPTL